MKLIKFVKSKLKKFLFLIYMFLVLIFFIIFVKTNVASEDPFIKWLINNLLNFATLYLYFLTVYILLSQVRAQFDEMRLSKQPKVAISKFQYYNSDLNVVFCNYSSNPAYEITIEFNDQFVISYNEVMTNSFSKEKKELESVISNYTNEEIENAEKLTLSQQSVAYVKHIQPLLLAKNQLSLIKLSTLPVIKGRYLSPNSEFSIKIPNLSEYKKLTNQDILILEFTISCKRNSNDKEALLDVIAIHI